MKLCIAEKPSVAKEIAQIVGANNRNDGYFEGNGYQVSWTFGHLCTLKEPHDYQEKWKYWNLNTLPLMPEEYDVKVINNQGVQKQFNTIKTLVASADEIINCGDAGQEGELIQRWVLEHAKNNKPVRRLWISSLTEEAIKEGFKSLKPQEQFDNLYEAGKSRAIGDWLLGMNATRLYTLKFAKDRQVLSIGRVQTPTLALIVNRQFEIDNFKPTIYWELKTSYKGIVFNRQAKKDEEDDGDGKIPKNSFKTVEEGKAYLTQIQEAPFEVVGVTKKKGKELPPKLFDLTSLQVECNKKFGLSAEETLKTVQSLYEKKLVTYPRVDTTYLSDDIYPKVPGILQGLDGYQNLTAPLLKDKIRKSKKVFDNKKVTDHHAIIPTGVKAYVGGYEKQVYDTITKRFIAVFYPDCDISNTTALGQVTDIPFKATGKQIINPGWRVVYGFNEEKAKEQGLFPAMEKGEQGPHEPDLQEKSTQAPKYFTEATLLRAMETAGKNIDDEDLREAMKENGIGRPSTRANIIETLFKRKYIIKDKKKMVATNVGIALIKAIKNELLKSAELTGQWEHKLRLIEKGDFASNTFLQEMNQMVKSVVNSVKVLPDNKWIGYEESMKQQKKVEKKANSSLGQCPSCKVGNIVKGKNAFGCTNYKNGCKFVVPFEIASKKISDSQIKKLISKGKTDVIKGFKKDGKSHNGYLEVVDGKYVVKAAKEEPLTCPKCKTGTFIKGKSAYGCSNYKNGCTMKIPFELGGKKLTANQIKQLQTKGKTSVIKGFKKNNGDSFNAKLYFNENFEIKPEVV